MAGTTIEITNLQEYNASIERLQGMGARKRDITAIFRNASKPLTKAKQARVGVSSHGVQSSIYRSRIHPPGTLRRSIKFVVSKRYKRVYFVVPTTKQPKPDPFYVVFYVKGAKKGVIGRARGKHGGYEDTKSKGALIGSRWVGRGGKVGGQRPKPFIEQAFNATYMEVSRRINEGFQKLENKLWQRTS
jgi:hypothetical protein